MGIRYELPQGRSLGRAVAALLSVTMAQNGGSIGLIAAYYSTSLLRDRRQSCILASPTLTSAELDGQDFCHALCGWYDAGYLQPSKNVRRVLTCPKGGHFGIKPSVIVQLIRVREVTALEFHSRQA